MQADILDRIVARRRERVAAEGPAQGLELPASRPAELPISPFPRPLICEFKRRSPSRGALAAEVDPVERAAAYREAGAEAVSVLTEQDNFSGSLADLIAVKRAYPDLAVLRKDFLLEPVDVEVAWRAGADAVLVIAAILSRDEIAALLREAERLGLAALVEVHDAEDVEKVRPLKPAVVGINSRDLRTFRVDLLTPVALIQAIDWPCGLIFESGIFHREDAELARETGFSAVLVGEAVVRDPARGRVLAEVMAGAGSGADRTGRAAPSSSAPGTAAGGAPEGAAPDLGAGMRPFWSAVATHRERLRAGGNRQVRPLIKICGITTEDDALLAQELGADLLGIVYAPSKRRAPEGLARRLRDAGVTLPLVAVVVEPGDDGHVERAQRDRDAGWISALQLHGEADAETAGRYGSPYFKAVKPADPDEARRLVAEARSVRLLVDARHPTLAGGTGRQVDPEILSAVREALAERPHGALWLAGGLGADNVAEVVKNHQPELIDASSRLEASPGRKDRELLRQFFKELA
ncbi:MAG: bifunctional indole-3-glycerol phosphate synthase/phosphoribosylanthranilate isomerase [Alkalispirochaeta sp.]